MTASAIDNPRMIATADPDETNTAAQQRMRRVVLGGPGLVSGHTFATISALTVIWKNQESIDGTKEI